MPQEQSNGPHKYMRTWKGNLLKSFFCLLFNASFEKIRLCLAYFQPVLAWESVPTAPNFREASVHTKKWSWHWQFSLFGSVLVSVFRRFQVYSLLWVKNPLVGGAMWDVSSLPGAFGDRHKASQAVSLLNHWFDVVGWWTVAETLQSLVSGETNDIRLLPTGRAYNAEHSVYLTWMAERLHHWTYTAPTH